MFPTSAFWSILYVKVWSKFNGNRTSTSIINLLIRNF